jgi:adenine-specific DNA-methyltransferase
MAKKIRPSFKLNEIQIEQIRTIVPEAFKDNMLDLGALNDALTEYADDEPFDVDEDYYGIYWPGKRNAKRMAFTKPKGSLMPVPGDGVDEDTTKNIYIEGDNLEVLKLLKKSYEGRIKMIYIDPPYNTGNDFIYEDDFSESVESFQIKIKQINDEGIRQTTNSKSDGRFHSNWISMMYPRLKLAHSLLKDDGVIFISIDDNEIVNLRLICDEIFGQENFFTQIIIQSNKRGQTYKQIAKTHEYLLLYTKQADIELNEKKNDDTSDLNLLDNISYFNIRELRNRNPKFGKHNRPNLFYPIYINKDAIDSDGFMPISIIKDNEYDTETLPFNSFGQESCWRWGKEKILKNNNADTNLVMLLLNKSQVVGIIFMKNTEKQLISLSQYGQRQLLLQKKEQ